MNKNSPDDYDEAFSDADSNDDTARRRVTRACDECRRKKIKCDGKQPCTHCTVYSYECTYDQPSNRRRNPAPQYVENLEHRVHRAETLLHILIPNLDLNDPGIDAAVQQGWIPGAPGKGNPGAATATAMQTLSNGPQTRPPPAPREQNKSDTNLESMVRAVANIEMDEHGNWDYHGHSSGLAFVRRMRDQLGDMLGPDVATTPFVKSRQMSQVLDSPRSVADSLGEASVHNVDLPSKDVAREVCSHAVDDAAALLRILHKPSFWSMFERIYNIPSDQYTNEESKFLPLFYSSMALGTLFGNEGQRLDRDGYENAIQKGFEFFRYARQLMDIADIRDLTSLQAVIFMILFLQSSAKMSQCYAYVGVALRSALRMGLHRAFDGNFDPIEAEMRKRIFWAVRKMDIYVGALLGLPQTLSDDDIDQEFPTEVDDEYVTKEGMRPMPANRVSLMTAFNAHTRLVAILQKIVRKIYPIKVQSQQGSPDKSYTVPFSAIREIESDLEDWKNSLPPILSPCQAPERYTRVQQLLRLAYAHTQVMLYRPFLHFVAADKGPNLVDQRAYACAASYVNVSRNIIHITTQMKQKGLLNGAFWFVMYTAFFSVLSLVYYAAENPDNSATEGVMKDAIEGKNVLTALSKRSLAADRCSATLDVVFSRLPEWLRTGKPNPATSKKRNLDSQRVRQHGSNSQASRSHPDVSTITSKPESSNGLNRRSSTFPQNGAQLPKVESHAVRSPWSQSGISSFGSQTPTTAGFENGGFAFHPGNGSVPANAGLQQFGLGSNVATPGLQAFSAGVFPSTDEPFNYPQQPLTTFENNQQYAKGNPYVGQGFNDGGQALGTSPAARAVIDDDMEAQFLPFPTYLEQGHQQPNRPSSTHPQTMRIPTSAMSFTQGPQMASSMDPITVANGGQWSNNQQMVGQDMSNINIQDLFGGNEWNPVFGPHTFR
ncbi:fungal transcriptional regulatory protein [Polychaeton citri CBS 116435]|uniref:Fungal transcriptional regulatory protein n=1 Tax=Polychaeton citri CBS 116435 TaxID=1314669 RepID=A0A9P4PZP4_9PEZI|nr:fungal transcriptional regulatory protein [Polychaeton citri CBS 116435]